MEIIGKKSGSIKGLRARGGFLVDISWKNGQLVEARITSTLGEKLNLRNGKKNVSVKTVKGQVIRVDGNLKVTKSF